MLRSALARTLKPATIFTLRRSTPALRITALRSMAVQTMGNDSELRALIDKNQDKLVIVDWTASWCGPCKQIAPVYEQLSNQYPHIVFTKCDVDELSDAASEAGVQSIPTFHFIKNNELVEEFAGADPNRLKSALEKHQ